MKRNNVANEEFQALEKQARSDGEEQVVPLSAVEYSLGYLAAYIDKLQDLLKEQIKARSREQYTVETKVE